jgi:carbamate kinase
MSRFVVSLGGNALGKNAEEQQELVAYVAEQIVTLIEEGHEVVVAHGNGPQVGMIQLAFTESNSTPDMPFPECGAMSQGYIGYHLQNAIGNELKKRGSLQSVATIVTQVIVDEDDQAFSNPTKPIGAFYTKQEAESIAKEHGFTMKEDANRGYRRVVPSPMPIDVKEKAIIKSLLKDHHVVITVGGGGIPVVENGHKLEGVAAVIDKDNASAKLAEIVEADELVILTAVDNVFIDFGKPSQKALKNITVKELQNYIDEGHFAEGSMLPKIKASIAFAKTGKTTVIASLKNAKLAFKQESGTIITNEDK